ncbi:hypothetical protein [Siccirubricoccus sp. G192]|uniref:hypothetical protein n=1 Tax=Siccirubricoccus sp. G192 TaxID=2849651 RepID=UPI001C2BEAA3|nr:hypothetical protein [Siccirubricoccus sp. G192]MBV1795632.1 hypothetical protein [Siccirubricoccus sp. G192]
MQIRLALSGPPGTPSSDATLGSQRQTTASISNTATTSRRGIHEVEAILKSTEQIIFVDDFHYISPPVQREVAQQIKTGADRGIKFCIASVPHRSDDVVRSNHELRGRTANIDTKYWTEHDLREIGIKGFDVLNAAVSTDFIEKLAVECCGSPQLMQSACLELCRHLDLKSTNLGILRPKLGNEDMEAVLARVSANANYATLVRNLHQGPRSKGQRRDRFPFADGTLGDAYRCVLLALSRDPPRLMLPYAEMMDRIKRVCTGPAPISASIQNACKQMTTIARKENGAERIIEWDERGGSGAFHIIDPYFLFYLRHSSQLSELIPK